MEKYININNNVNIIKDTAYHRQQATQAQQ